jgi:hypothetical protein
MTLITDQMKVQGNILKVTSTISIENTTNINTTLKTTLITTHRIIVDTTIPKMTLTTIRRK